jgi:hypothetical protein
MGLKYEDGEKAKRVNGEMVRAKRRNRENGETDKWRKGRDT